MEAIGINRIRGGGKSLLCCRTPWLSRQQSVSEPGCVPLHSHSAVQKGHHYPTHLGPALLLEDSWGQLSCRNNYPCRMVVPTCSLISFHWEHEEGQSHSPFPMPWQNPCVCMLWLFRTSTRSPALVRKPNQAHACGNCGAASSLPRSCPRTRGRTQ